jgi:hypothetical protein
LWKRKTKKKKDEMKEELVKWGKRKRTNENGYWRDRKKK